MERYICLSCGTEYSTTKTGSYTPTSPVWPDGHTCVFQKVGNSIDKDKAEMQVDIELLQEKVQSMSELLLSTDFVQFHERLRRIEEKLFTDTYGN